MTDAAQTVPFVPTEPYRFCPADGTKLEKPHPTAARDAPVQPLLVPQFRPGG